MLLELLAVLLLELGADHTQQEPGEWTLLPGDLLVLLTFY